ncbi:gamma-secretase subunit PEN-2-like [Branchiostoma lanceolatum]|uniref:gamma-secretase subunit PEN-2-like n=1 Tax=Branchiostoma lanceolatum TaxID=7740 RepID=UPI001132F185
MNLNRVKDEDKLELCRKYYYGGFFALPFLWFVNVFWFFKQAFIRPAFEQQQQIKSYIIKSLVGCILWTAVLVTWMTIFQLYRAEWGEVADNMSFIIPKGIA